MLETVNYLPVALMRGCYKFPKGARIIGTYAVAETKTGKCGILLKLTSGYYSLFTAGALCSVDQEEAKRIEDTLKKERSGEQ